MQFFKKLSKEKQGWLREMLLSQHADIFCEELLEAFAERCHAIENDAISMAMLRNNFRLVVPVQFREETIIWALTSTHY